MAGYTAITKKRLRGETGSLSYKLATEYGLIATLLDGVDREATAMTLTKATITLTASTALNLDGAYCQFGGATGATGRITPAAASTTIIGGGTAADSLILQGSLANATEKITILGGTSITILGTSVILDGTISVAAGHTLALPNGTTVNEFSIDGTLGGNSDDAIPTEKAVKTYVDTQILTKDTFLELTDTPSSYTANGAIYVADNSNSEVDESAVILAEGTNTFSLTKGTASLDIAGGAALNIDANLTVSNAVTLAATNAGAIDFGAASKTLTISETCTIDQDLQQSASPTFVTATLTSAQVTNIKANDGTASISIADSTGIVSASKKISLTAASGTASDSGLLFGIGTTGDPATNATADGKFIELKCKTTATSGDCRLQYMRYYMNGINATGGECLKAGTVLGAAIGTARGEQASIEVSSTGYVTGFACGMDALLEVTNTAVPSGGTYCAGQSQVFMTGSSSDLSAAASHAIHRFSVAGGSAVAEAKVLNAFNFDVTNCADAGGGEMVSPGANEGATTGTIRILINGDIRYLAYYSHEGHS